jgi:hypothetical protein
MKDPDCPLCRLTYSSDVKTSLVYRDSVIMITYCSKHEDQPLVVSITHKLPSPKDLRHIREVCLQCFPDKKFRGYMNSMPNHWHDHLI